MVDNRLALMGGGCGTGVLTLVVVAELGREAPPDFGLWKSPILSSWYHDAILDVGEWSSCKGIISKLV